MKGKSPNTDLFEKVTLPARVSINLWLVGHGRSTGHTGPKSMPSPSATYLELSLLVVRRRSRHPDLPGLIFDRFRVAA
jgi:hypothetical protein